MIDQHQLTFMLLHFQDISKKVQPKFALAVETDELFIQAGLMDRVIQVSQILE